METPSPGEKLPARLAWPFIAVNALLFVVSLLNLSHKVDGPALTIVSMLLAFLDLVMGIAMLVWLRRRAARS
jgi:NADH:ubiquinone oxidoreductase subunit K